MVRLHRGPASTFAAVALAGMLSGCASPDAGKKAPAPDAARAVTPPPNDDWRALLMVPFGTLLRDVPYRLGEVVVFHDATGGAAAHEDGECYTLEGTAPPRWFGEPVGEYSLCFSRDRLNRIEASASLAPESASARFAAACAEWARRGTPGAMTADRCEDRDGTTQIEARLTASGTSAEPAVSITLVDLTPLRDDGP